MINIEKNGIYLLKIEIKYIFIKNKKKIKKWYLKNV